MLSEGNEMAANEHDVVLAAVGDVSPNRDDPPSLFRFCRDALRSADIVFGQMEAPLSDRGTPRVVHGTPRRLAAKNISALTEEGAGFDVMSFATHHSVLYGPEAFNDTIDALKRNSIAVCGAGANIRGARMPAFLEKNGTRMGFLAYLSVIVPGAIAEENSFGCAPLRASTTYKQVHYCEGTPPLIITKLYPEDKAAMEEDVRKLRPQVDVLVVSMHAGVVTIPAMIAMYQKEAAHAAIDAGADLVLMHHAHILKGIEVYKGKAIFYGLGNFAQEHTLGFPGEVKGITEGNVEFRKVYRFIKHEPGYEKNKFSHDSLKTMIVKAYIQDKKIRKVTYMPACINANLEPEVVARADQKAQDVFNYVRQISEDEDLKVAFSWEGDEVLISSPVVVSG